MLCLMAVIGFGIGDAMAQKKQVDLKTTVFQTDVDCENCAKKVDNSIPYQKGVKEVKVDVSTQTVTVTYDKAKTNDEALLKAFKKVKVNAEVKEVAAK
ncbi:MAG: heavy-metal-associated domain-containing protein [Alistipes sp.]|nr:heavy-metal-associated domain-containing protein [Alistipes sp.]MBQ8438841.1 heavy-metal-associated domain-containing protein [Alistipes sp.]MBQ8554026.1 heavy-metal-associated domain-containing protein [Alistipes sp.]MBR2073291.1 heavy-metal-associated domain-containing protein [Alistipes sp.]MBR3886905.1 heavy-metal-associated domain-containing protein [Alistipes sp.]